MALSCQEFWAQLKFVAASGDEPIDEIFDAIDNHLDHCPACQQVFTSTPPKS